MEPKAKKPVTDHGGVKSKNVIKKMVKDNKPVLGTQAKKSCPSSVKMKRGKETTVVKKEKVATNVKLKNKKDSSEKISTKTMKSQSNDSKGKKLMRKSWEKTENRKKSVEKKQEARIIDDEFIPEVKMMFYNAKEEEMLVAKLPETPEEENVKDEEIKKRLSMFKRFNKGLMEDKNYRTKVKAVKMENDAPKNVDKKTNITRIKSQVLRNVKTDNKFGSAAEKGEN